MEQIGRALKDAGFDEAAIAAAVGSAPVPEAVPLHAKRSANDQRVALVRLFVLGEVVRADELPIAAEALEGHGLVERAGDSLRAPLRLTPYAGMLFAHDDERSTTRDVVSGINNATRTLATLTVRSHVKRALDLGTGCGVQALLARQHADEVVATDVNPRALHYAGLNARLNGARVDLREGSWFDPVADELFDLVVANPPFVISPDTEYVFRDSGLGRDAVCREVVRGAAAHLRTGGFATILCNWIGSAGETWQPLEEWVADTGCDALLLAHEPVDPFQYAASWNEPLRREPDKFSAAIERWLAYYEREGITSIGIGAVVLRRRDAEPWTRGLDVPRPATGKAGEHILRLFAATDAPLPQDIRDRRFRLVSAHRLDQSLIYRGGYELGDVTMTLEDGVGLVGRVNALALPVLFALDGERSFGEIVAEVDADDDAARAAAETLKRLHSIGFVEQIT